MSKTAAPCTLESMHALTMPRCLCSYTYTAADVKQMLAEKKARGSTGMNIAAEKARLTRERDHAQEVGDVNEIERYVKHSTGSVNGGCNLDN